MNYKVNTIMAESARVPHTRVGILIDASGSGSRVTSVTTRYLSSSPPHPELCTSKCHTLASSTSYSQSRYASPSIVLCVYALFIYNLTTSSYSVCILQYTLQQICLCILRVVLCIRLVECYFYSSSYYYSTSTVGVQMLYTIYKSMHRYIYELVYYIITIRTTRILYEYTRSK